MKKFKVLGLVVATLALGGCMATLNPDGTISAGYIIPEVSSVVINNRPSRPVIVHKPSHRPTYHAWNTHRPNNGRPRPR